MTPPDQIVSRGSDNELVTMRATNPILEGLPALADNLGERREAPRITASGAERTEMINEAHIRQALTALEARRLELERVISDDLERKFLSDLEPYTEMAERTYSHSGGYSLDTLSESVVAGFSTVTWLA